MAPMRLQYLAGSLLLFSFHSRAQTTTLNLSHDLVTDGIAASNMTPGQATLDSRPLLEAGMTYAASHGIKTVIADPGTYYFLSQRNSNTHALINGAANVTLNLQNSNLLFAFSNVAAIQCTNCTNVTLENFTVDYQQLPFTQATVASVNTAAQSIAYQMIPGYQDPVAFNANRAPDGSDAIYMFLFHNGVPIQQVGRLTAQRPVSGGVIAVADTKDPWATPSALAAIQPGDTIVFTDRSGPPALNIVNGASVTLESISVYAAGQIAVYFGRTNGATADHVQVIPKPGTGRLISSNADGIHTSFALGPNIYTNNIVRRTCDDAIALAAPWLATVTQVNGTTVTVARNFSSPFPPGVVVAFIDPVTAAVIGTATIAFRIACLRPTVADGGRDSHANAKSGPIWTGGERWDGGYGPDEARQWLGHREQHNSRGRFFARHLARGREGFQRTRQLHPAHFERWNLHSAAQREQRQYRRRPFLRHHDPEQPGG
jgi:hypothetical protein